MFEFGRELRRIFGPEISEEARPGLLELIDLSLLRREAVSAEGAARRAGTSDRADRYAEAALLHREIARRTGEAESLRRSASAAEALRRRLSASPVRRAISRWSRAASA